MLEHWKKGGRCSVWPQQSEFAEIRRQYLKVLNLSHPRLEGIHCPTVPAIGPWQKRSSEFHYVTKTLEGNSHTVYRPGICWCEEAAPFQHFPKGHSRSTHEDPSGSSSRSLTAEKCEKGFACFRHPLPQILLRNFLDLCTPSSNEFHLTALQLGSIGIHDWKLATQRAHCDDLHLHVPQIVQRFQERA
jgi:hypothetical protein